MIFRIGCVDGKTYQSDWFSDEEASRSVETTGAVADYDNYVEIAEMLSDGAIGVEVDDLDFDKVTVVINGISRKFRPAHIIWAEVLYGPEYGPYTNEPVEKE